MLGNISKKKRLPDSLTQLQATCSSSTILRNMNMPTEKSPIRLKVKLVDTRKDKKLSSFFE